MMPHPLNPRSPRMMLQTVVVPMVFRRCPTRLRSVGRLPPNGPYVAKNVGSNSSIRRWRATPSSTFLYIFCKKIWSIISSIYLLPRY